MNQLLDFRSLWPFLGALLSASCEGSMQNPSSARPDAGGWTDAGASEAILVTEAGHEDGSDASIASIVNTDAAACFISAANYDQSCSADTDCISTVTVPGLRGDVYVHFGNYCKQICLYCGGDDSTISKNAVAQYVADVSKTPAGSGEVPVDLCSCKAFLAPKCVNGSCVGFE